MAILEIKNIKKDFGKTKVLKDISFSLEKGQVLAIIGSSGSGKTTLLRCLNFLETPDEGQIFFKVVLLQVIKRILAPMSNEIITLVKDTSLARVISVYEIIWAGESFIKKGLIWPLFYTGVFYLVFSGGLTVLFAKLEKKLNYFRG